MKKGIVCVECPICKGLGLGTDLNGKQLRCSVCNNIGFLTTPLDKFEDGVRTDERAKQSIKCSNCVNHLTASDEAQIRLDERNKFAEWLVKNVCLDCDDCNYVSGCMDLTTTCADNLLNAYEKEQKGETE